MSLPSAAYRAAVSTPGTAVVTLFQETRHDAPAAGQTGDGSVIYMQARIGEQEERGTLLRALIGAEGVITPDSLIEVCGLVELMLDPTKAHGERRRYGQPIAAALLRRYETCYGAPRAMFDGRSFYRLERLLAGEPGAA